jgi:predicted DNA-binding protein
MDPAANLFFEKDKDVELAGGYIPRHLSEELNLLALHLNTTKSEIIRQLIIEKLNDTDIEEITSALAKRMVDSFRAHRKETGEELKFTDYCKQTRQNFANKKIATIHVDRILLKAKELYYANKSAKVK